MFAACSQSFEQVSSCGEIGRKKSGVGLVQAERLGIIGAIRHKRTQPCTPPPEGIETSPLLGGG